LGYPDRDAERRLLSGIERRDIISTLLPCMENVELQAIQKKVREVHASSALLDYIQAIISYTRSSPAYVHGMSPRAGLALLYSARAWALMDKRNQVLPEDVQAVLPGVVGHRLHSTGDHTRSNGTDLVENIIREVAIP
ncbi:MAG: AAA family ATPase, partial [Nitrosomonadaceae bacterium]